MDTDFKYNQAFAGMLASENIIVISGSEHNTASFDTQTRTLALPSWTVSKKCYQMLCLHEVAHALFTADEYGMKIKEAKIPFSYFNVLEDMRIEKLMKRRFRGSPATFAAGYSEVTDYLIHNETGFEDAIKNASTLIEQINGKYKFQGTYNWTAEELLIYTEALETETVDDVIELAKKIAKLQKERDKEEEQAEPMKGSSDESDVSETDETDKSDVSDEKSDEQEVQDGVTQNDENTSETDETDSTSSIEQSEDTTEQNETDLRETESDDKSDLREMADDYTNVSGAEAEDFVQKMLAKETLSSSANIYYTPNYTDGAVIDYKKTQKAIAKNIEDILAGHIKIKLRKSKKFAWKNVFSKLNSDTIPAINTFKRKQNAISYSKQKISDTGDINLNKLYQYKTTDDIFIKQKLQHKGQNHGLIVSLDWSGSMDSVLLTSNALRAISLAIFCRKIGLAYSIQIWTSSDIGGGEARINEVLSSDMSQSEFLKSAEAFYTLSSVKRTRWDNYRYGLGLSGTPTAETVLAQALWAKTWKSRLKLEKITNIIMSDGGANGASCPFINFNGRTYPAVECKMNISNSNKALATAFGIFKDHCNGNIVYLSVGYDFNGYDKSYAKALNGCYLYNKDVYIKNCKHYVITRTAWAEKTSHCNDKVIELDDIVRNFTQSKSNQFIKDFFINMASHIALGE